MSLTAATDADLRSAGLDDKALAAWRTAIPRATADISGDRRNFAEYWRQAEALLRRLPPKPERNPVQASAAQSILHSSARAARAFSRRALRDAL